MLLDSNLIHNIIWSVYLWHDNMMKLKLTDTQIILLQHSNHISPGKFVMPISTYTRDHMSIVIQLMIYTTSKCLLQYLIFGEQVMASTITVLPHTGTLWHKPLISSVLFLKWLHLCIKTICITLCSLKFNIHWPQYWSTHTPTHPPY